MIVTDCYKAYLYEFKKYTDDNNKPDTYKQFFAKIAYSLIFYDKHDLRSQVSSSQQEIANTVSIYIYNLIFLFFLLTFIFIYKI